MLVTMKRKTEKKLRNGNCLAVAVLQHRLNISGWVIVDCHTRQYGICHSRQFAITFTYGKNNGLKETHFYICFYILHLFLVGSVYTMYVHCIRNQLAIAY